MRARSRPTNDSIECLISYASHCVMYMDSVTGISMHLFGRLADSFSFLPCLGSCFSRLPPPPPRPRPVPPDSPVAKLIVSSLCTSIHNRNFSSLDLSCVRDARTLKQHLLAGQCTESQCTISRIGSARTVDRSICLSASSSSSPIKVWNAGVPRVRRKGGSSGRGKRRAMSHSQHLDWWRAAVGLELTMLSPRTTYNPSSTCSTPSSRE